MNTQEKKQQIKRDIIGSAIMLMLIAMSFAMGWNLRGAGLLSASDFNIVIVDDKGNETTVPVYNMHKIIKP